MNIDVQSVLNRYTRATQREYQIQCIRDTVNGLNQGVDVEIDLPTGTGKTFIFAPIAADLSESGRRVLVLGATKQSQHHLHNDILRFKDDKKLALIFGVQQYYCPILREKAQNWCCGELKEDYCKPTGINCDVIKAEHDYSAQNLVVTNFSKFLLSVSENDYDLIVLDDSHSFENVKEQAYQISLRFGLIRQLYEAGKMDQPLLDLVENFLNIFGEIFERCVNPGETEGAITLEYLVRIAKLLPDDDKDNALQTSISKLPEIGKTVCWNIFYFIKRCKTMSLHQFYVRKDFYDSDDWDSCELISRRDGLLSAVIKKRFGNSRVVYATATPGDIRSHASSCTLRDYDNNLLLITPTSKGTFPEIENWFQNLLILGVGDIGDTRNSLSFENAMQLATEILQSRNERTLVLFKNYRDQRVANEKLSRIFNQNRLFFIDNATQDSDEVEEFASKTQISLASASSTLWEGINIQNLRITIIVSPPYIRPHAGQKENFAYFERRMMTRLQQGIGRLIRGPSDFGVAVLMDSRFEALVHKKSFNEKLKERVILTERASILNKMEEFFSERSSK